MTAEQIKALGLPTNTDDALTQLSIGAAFDWIANNTTLVIDLDAPEEISDSVKIFVLKFAESTARTDGIANESLGGLSQSFQTGTSGEEFVWVLARQLLGLENLKSGVTSIPARRKWTGWV